jgi:hypothetical protein
MVVSENCHDRGKNGGVMTARGVMTIVMTNLSKLATKDKTKTIDSRIRFVL